MLEGALQSLDSFHVPLVLFRELIDTLKQQVSVSRIPRVTPMKIVSSMSGVLLLVLDLCLLLVHSTLMYDLTKI